MLRTGTLRESVASAWKSKLPFIQSFMLPPPAFLLFTHLTCDHGSVSGWLPISPSPTPPIGVLHTNSSHTSFRPREPLWHSAIIVFLHLGKSRKERKSCLSAGHSKPSPNLSWPALSASSSFVLPVFWRCCWALYFWIPRVLTHFLGQVQTGFSA